MNRDEMYIFNTIQSFDADGKGWTPEIIADYCNRDIEKVKKLIDSLNI